MFVIDGVVSAGQNAAEPTATETTAAPAEGAPQEAAPAEPARDPAVPVTVLNGTAQAGVAGSTSEKLSGLGWNVVTTGDADNDEHTASVVYYGDAADEGAALALVQDLGGGTATLDPAQASAGTITVVIGTDLA
nr:LytR C-terminal domain-containing protein [Pseudoclavibacter chungangensis]